MSTFTNVTDLPETLSDGLGIARYKDGLKKFLIDAQTPLTVAVQGEWGSGKTTLLRFLQQELCINESKYYGVWISTWEYGLMVDANVALITIIQAIIDKVIFIIEQSSLADSEKFKRKVVDLMTKVSKVALKSTAYYTGGEGAGQVVDKLFETEDRYSSIAQLRNALQDIINQFLEKNPQRGFIFFIDDLDRLSPPVAVQILELLKNIFDLEGCIFLLAIDYDVVVKGLEPKFGKKTEVNEREFRSFFEKIIQLPFTMPVNNYHVKEFLIKNLGYLGLIGDDTTDEQADLLLKVGLLTVGKNPRAIKRLVNAVSLVNCINHYDDSKTYSIELINFFLLATQISYPQIYRVLSAHPDFTNWNKELTAEYQLNSEVEDLFVIDRVDIEWKKVLYALCIKDYYLKSKYLTILSLFELIDDYCTKREVSVSNEICRGLQLSSITSVGDSSDDLLLDKEYSRFEFQGNVYDQSKLVNAVLRSFIDRNPTYTISDLRLNFPNEIQGNCVFVTKDEALYELSKNGYCCYLVEDNDLIETSDGFIATNNQWVLESIKKFIKHVNEMRVDGFRIKHN